MPTYDVHVVLKLSIPVEADSEFAAEQEATADPQLAGSPLGEHLANGNYEVDVQHVEEVLPESRKIPGVADDTTRWAENEGLI